MGKDHRPWRKLIKKLRRKRIRTQVAKLRDGPNQDDDNDDDSEIDKLKLEEENYLHKLEQEKWLEREKQAQLTFQMKKAEEERRLKLKQEEEKRIREEWEELKEKAEKECKELERIAEESRQKQEQEFKEFLDFLSGDIETPPLPYLMSEEDTTGDICPFYMRTAVCRFGQHCTRSHPRPTLSRIILIPNFFSHFSIEQTLRDEYDTDLNLEYEESDLYKEFLEFYDDVMPELKRFGDVIQFKVCCNFEPHLRGNVYVQYKDIRQAVEAYRCFNGRFYNGKQLSLQFVKIDSWRSAICGLFSRKRNCPKLKSCNFLHVFRNPTKEFVLADNDWQEKKLVKSTTAHQSATYSKETRRESLHRKTDVQKSTANNINDNNNSDKNSRIPSNDNDKSKNYHEKTKYLNTDFSKSKSHHHDHHQETSDLTRGKRSRSYSRTKELSTRHHHDRSRSRESRKLDECKNKEKDSKHIITMKKKKKKDKKKEHKSSKNKYSQSTCSTHSDRSDWKKKKRKQHKRSKSKDRSKE